MKQNEDNSTRLFSPMVKYITTFCISALVCLVILLIYPGTANRVKAEDEGTTNDDSKSVISQVSLYVLLPILGVLILIIIILGIALIYAYIKQRQVQSQLAIPTPTDMKGVDPTKFDLDHYDAWDKQRNSAMHSPGSPRTEMGESTSTESHEIDNTSILKNLLNHSQLGTTNTKKSGLNTSHDHEIVSSFRNPKKYSPTVDSTPSETENTSKSTPTTPSTPPMRLNITSTATATKQSITVNGPGNDEITRQEETLASITVGGTGGDNRSISHSARLLKKAQAKAKAKKGAK